MSTIRSWLAGLSLERYAEVFEREELTLEALGEVGEDDLKLLGLPLGPRKIVLKALATLRGDAAALANAPSTAGAAPVNPESPSAERRQLTVMFCDLVGSTELSGRLDPEALRELMRAYQGACRTVIEKYDGHIAQYLGDGLMVYFGWPRAHEDDAERSVRASLDIVGAVKAVAAPARLQVRIGIATGPVVVGEAEDGTTPRLAVGETPNLAARLQALAPPDRIVVAPSTYRLLGQVFEAEDLGSHTLKGILEPVRVRLVIGAVRTEGRFEASRGDRLTPMVGREDELALLRRRWEQVRAGEGRFVLINGEPGIGKSRITRALMEDLKDQNHICVRLQCSPFHTRSALHPLIEHLEFSAGFSKDDLPAERLLKLETWVTRTNSKAQLPAVVPLFAAMLSIPAPGYPPIALTAQKQKQRTLEALVNHIVRISSDQPILMIFEDLHWIDPTTEEVIDLLARRIAHLRVMMVATFRPEYAAKWKGEAHINWLSLNRLNRKLSAALTENVAAGKTLPQELAEQILDRTDGVPLFVEELTKAVLESGLVQIGALGYELTGPLPALAIPSSLQDSLMSRLDRLSDVRGVAQIGAALGRTFSHELITAVSGMSESVLSKALGQLGEAELVACHGAPPDASYTFKHALVQDAAYSSLLQSRRQILHREIAQTLLARFPERAAQSPEEVAHHYESAGLVTEAVACHLRAGQHAIIGFAMREAIAHLRNGLRLIPHVPDVVERNRLELQLQAELGTALGTSMGYTPPETAEAFERARQLIEVVGDVPEKFMILFGLMTSFLMRARYAESWNIAHQLLKYSATATDPGIQITIRECIACNALFTGDFEQCIRYGQEGIRMYRAAGCPNLGPAFGFDPGVICCEFTAWALQITGKPDQALKVWQEGAEYARRHRHVLTMATNIVHESVLLQFRHDEQPLLEGAAQARHYCAEHGILLREAEAKILLGWAQARCGDIAGGIAETEAGLVVWRQLGARIFDSGWYLMLAESCLNNGSVDRARSAHAEAMASAQEYGEHIMTAELQRFDAVLCLAEKRPVRDAEARFKTSLEQARGQGARFWELRTSTSYARLMQSQGRRQDALELLKPVYNWFTEGFDTRDLKEAKAFLDELEAAA